MGTYNNVNLAVGQVVEDFAGLFGAFHAREVLDAHREILEASREGAVVLQRKDGGRHQYGYLFAVGGGLEGGADSDLGLAEADVAADQAVHRHGLFHVLLDGLGGALLVGGVFVEERRFELLLQEAVVRVGEPGAGLAFGVEGDQFAGDVLDLVFGGLFQLLPGAGAEFVDFGLGGVLVLVFTDAVERVDVDEQDVVVLVDQFDELLHRAVGGAADQTAEAAHAVVDVDHVVADLEGIQFGDGHAFAAVDLAGHGVAVVAVEDLVVGVEGDLERRHHETAVERERDMAVADMGEADRFEDVFETFHLGVVLG